MVFSIVTAETRKNVRSITFLKTNFRLENDIL